MQMHPPLYIVLVGPLHSLSQSFSYASAHTHICASTYTHICALKIYLHSLMYNSRLTAQLGVTLPIFCPPDNSTHDECSYSHAKYFRISVLVFNLQIDCSMFYFTPQPFLSVDNPVSTLHL